MTAAIETVGLTKMFGATRGIEGLNLRVEPGEIFGFLGPNGAGKSTTIRALLDLHHPTTGTAWVLGLDAHRDSVTIHRRVGYLPGDLALFGRMTARDHVTWFARARGLEGTRQADAFTQGPGRRGPLLGGVVGARGHLQNLADGLDPELVPVGVDEVDDHLCGRSSSAAKKVEARRRIDGLNRWPQWFL